MFDIFRKKPEVELTEEQKKKLEKIRQDEYFKFKKKMIQERYAEKAKGGGNILGDIKNSPLGGMFDNMAQAAKDEFSTPSDGMFGSPHEAKAKRK